LLHLVLALLAVVPDEVGDEVAVGAVLDAKIAIFEDLAQARCPLGLARKVVDEAPLPVGHRLVRRLRALSDCAIIARLCALD